VRRNVKVMLTFALTPVKWCITSTHHRTKTLIKNTTWKSIIVIVMLCGARDRTCGQRERGSCIMTTYQLIPRNWFKRSWLNTTFLWFDRLPTLPTWLLVFFWLFPRLNMQLKGAQFESRNEIIWNTTAKLYSIRKEAFQKCFEQWQNRWEMFVQSQGDYFDGD
jgi:hypothetical protein